MVVLKLWGVYRTQSCDAPRGLEDVGLKMSKLELNCLSTYFFTHLYKLSS
jgi:hypothetical protein